MARLFMFLFLGAMIAGGCGDGSMHVTEQKPPRVRVRLPGGFEKAPLPLTNVVDPREIYAASTVRLPQRVRFGRGCVPAKALAFPERQLALW